MQWLLQEFDDTHKLAEALDRLGIAYTWHKVVPFVGDLYPEPEIADRDNVMMFGSYTLWRYAEKNRLKPGVFRIRPFVEEVPWQPYLLNGADALFLTLREIPENLPDTGKLWFIRPVEDSKEEPGRVRSDTDIRALAEKVLALNEQEIPHGSLRHDTRLMLTQPANIRKEWRIWIVNGKVVTYSLYKEGARVVYRPEIDEDALQFAGKLASLHPDYSPAYVMDICQTDRGLKMLETNCINAAGFYAADLQILAESINRLGK